MEQRITTFYLAAIDRPSLIEPHDFFVSEARKRLLVQFNNIEQEAKLITEQYLEESRLYLDPEFDDESSVYERAEQRGVSHWLALKDLQKNTMLALTAGMFHLFDKTLRKKMCHEFSNWLDDHLFCVLIWNTSFHRIIDLLEWIGIQVTDKEFFSKLETCNLLVNVYKHGDGNAHKRLSSTNPEYYPNGYTKYEWKFQMDHIDLEVSETQFIEFSEAINAFWENIPQYTFYSQLKEEPKWLKDELKRLKK